MILIIIITIWKGAIILIFPNQFQAPQGCSCQWVSLLNVQIITLLFTFQMEIQIERLYCPQNITLNGNLLYISIFILLQFYE